MAADLSEYLGTTTLAVGALGAASFGIVDGLKLVPWVDLAGFEHLFSAGGPAGGRMWPRRKGAGLDPLLPALKAAKKHHVDHGDYLGVKGQNPEHTTASADELVVKFLAGVVKPVWPVQRT